VKGVVPFLLSEHALQETSEYTLVNSIVHEIRNHLAVAVANIEAFRDGVFAPTPQRLAAVLQALEEAGVLLSELPAVQANAAVEPEMQVINVCDVISNEVLALEAAARKRGIDFDVRRCATTNDACHAFRGSPVRIAEIVNNVVSNAIRYTPAGGAIDVDCRYADGTLVLTVHDGGPGVAPDDRVRIFEAGYRGAAAEGIAGSGLGLGLARRFVEAHGGTISLADDETPGARFVVTLPGEPVPATRTTTDGAISLL
jgi:signal transduction histidine kinase